MLVRESDQLIVLRAGEMPVHGEATDNLRSFNGNISLIQWRTNAFIQRKE